MRRHYDGTCVPVRVGEEVDPKKCPHCLKEFSRPSAVKTHVGNGCPSLSATGTAAEARRAREEAAAQKKRSEEYYRCVTESRKQEREATGWLEYYKEKEAADAEKIAALEEKIRKLEVADAPVPVVEAHGGAGTGSATAGRDATTIGNQVNLNFYGSEQMDPCKFEGLVERLVKGLERGIAAGHGENQLRATTIAGGVRLLLKEPENQVVKGWEEGKDEVGVHTGEGEWGVKPAEEVASRYGRELRDKMRAAHMTLSFDEMNGEELAHWSKEEGGDAVRRAALENEVTTAATRLEKFKKGKKDYWD